MTLLVLLLVLICGETLAQKDPHWLEGRNTIVHLFEWKYPDIGKECEDFLGPKGFAGVQTSPPTENLVIQNRPWWERYQPVSYQLTTRSGTEDEFYDMVKRCNAAGVRVYPDVVLNHMTGLSGTGTAGSTADYDNKSYPAIPFSSENFHDTCSIESWDDAEQVRNCENSGLRDLDQSQAYVRQQITDYLNRLIGYGVAGFRVDSCKLMWPEDLQAIFESLDNLNTYYDFPEGSRAFIIQEITDDGVVKKSEYASLGVVSEFSVGLELTKAFTRETYIGDLENWGSAEWGMVDREDGLFFIENHENQREPHTNVLNYKNPEYYKAAIAFMMAHPYAKYTRIFSGYYFSEYDQGPPSLGGEIVSPRFDATGACKDTKDTWVCEHRVRAMYNMVDFRNAVEGTDINNWYSSLSKTRIAFGRGDKGFFAASSQGDFDMILPTNLPDGYYCDMLSGSIVNGKCTGTLLSVMSGQIRIRLLVSENEAAVAIHVNARVDA